MSEDLVDDVRPRLSTVDGHTYLTFEGDGVYRVEDFDGPAATYVLRKVETFPREDAE